MTTIGSRHNVRDVRSKVIQELIEIGDRGTLVTSLPSSLSKSTIHRLHPSLSRERGTGSFGFSVW